MFSPFHMNSTRLAIAALSAQDERYRPPAADALLTGREFAQQYLIPLAHTDLLSDHVLEHRRVHSIGRSGWLKHEGVDSGDRARSKFLILSRDIGGGEHFSTADVVIDTTGTYANPCWMGDGGIPAIGEIQLFDQFQHRVPDILDQDRSRYENRHTLVVGSGYSAATSIVLLAELAESASHTRATWLTRAKDANAGPMAVFENDRLPSRLQIAEQANRLALDPAGPVRWICGGSSIQSIEKNGDQFQVSLAGEVSETLQVDHIVANTGYHPDATIYRELQVHECYATSGPMKLAAALAHDKGQDCLDQMARGAGSLLTTEPNFYILGSKSYGQDSRFLLSIGHLQIRDLFSIIADRSDLDLYKTIQL
jgi:hypothetical protein